MAKSGTTKVTASKMVNASKSGVRHGQNSKRVVMGGKSAPAPSGPTAPIKGMDKGGV